MKDEHISIYCCKEHIELGLDDIVNKYETPPILQACKTEKELSTTCEYCEDKSAYIVTNAHSHTKSSSVL
ncbi:CxxH/CxxC protein [Bacillus chungangensis]|uniref:CxxH/CxxC protein (TIGR04129 family) n=1 Tax=Bacillus chungangensis TaxID=587633 RepID=A0ABT9WSK1_9BACI|nr:CxxH/CxxC protein [Bacillus chungangensis]MDQ0176273.1 CxxH/CxxC protein (TIGR04129 family) [Bacillus chungangensis]